MVFMLLAEGMSITFFFCCLKDPDDILDCGTNQQNLNWKTFLKLLPKLT